MGGTVAGSEAGVSVVLPNLQLGGDEYNSTQYSYNYTQYAYTYNYY